MYPLKKCALCVIPGIIPNPGDAQGEQSKTILPMGILISVLLGKNKRSTHLIQCDELKESKHSLSHLILYVLSSYCFGRGTCPIFTRKRHLPTIQSISSVLSPYSPCTLFPRNISVVIRGVCTCRKETKRRKGLCLFLKINNGDWSYFYLRID